MSVPITYFEMAGIVTICLGLLEIIKFLVNKLVTRAGEERMANIEDKIEQVSEKTTRSVVLSPS